MNSQMTGPSLRWRLEAPITPIFQTFCSPRPPFELRESFLTGDGPTLRSFSSKRKTVSENYRVRVHCKCVYALANDLIGRRETFREQKIDGSRARTDAHKRRADLK